MKLTHLLSLYLRIRREERTLRETVAKRPQPRASAFVLESLETRMMLSATPMEVTPVLTSELIETAAIVSTNYQDYAPGETAVITTSNTTGAGLQFSAGELVRFQVTRTDGVADAPSGPASIAPAGNTPWYVIDGVGGFTAHQQFEANGQAIDRDANGLADWIAPDNDLTVNGSISTAWFVEEQYLGASLQLTAVGQNSGAVASAAFTDAASNTTTSVTSSATPSTYGTSVTFTATVTAATGIDAPTGTVQFFDGATSLGIDSTANSTGIGTSTWSITTASLNAGTHASIHAVYTATGSFNDSTSGNITQTVNKATATINVSGYSGVYDGAAHTATGTAVGLELGETLPIPIQIGGGLLDVSTDGITNSAPFGNNGYRYVNTVFPADQEAQVTLAGAPTAGSGHFTFLFLRTQNPNTTSLDAYYIGYVEAGASGTWIVGRFVNNNSLAVSQTSSTRLAVGDQIRATVVGNAVTAYSYHNGVWAAEVSHTMTGADIVSGPGYLGLEISGNSPEITLTNVMGGAYTGGTAKGVLGESLSGLDLSGTTHTNAGTYTDTWTFTDATGNYENASGTVSDSIAKADATVTVNGYTGVYDGAAHGATGTATGVGGVDLSTGLTLGATFTNVPGGTANWTFNGGTNYNNQSGSVAIVIGARAALLNYIGETMWVTSGKSSTASQVTLSASMQDPTGTALVGATVDFIDRATGKVLAGGIKVSQVAGSPDNTGTANTVVTLSSGKEGAAAYEILVKFTGNYDNSTQALADKTATLSVSKPTDTYEITGAGKISALGSVAGSYRSTSDVTYTVDLKYNKSGTNPQGKITLAIPQADGSVISITSNSISSINITGTTDKSATVYTKASISKVLADGSVVTIDGNVTLRMDMVEYVNPAMKDQVGFTVLSTKDSSVYYSNNWGLVGNVWKTQMQDVDETDIKIKTS